MKGIVSFVFDATEEELKEIAQLSEKPYITGIMADQYPVGYLGNVTTYEDGLSYCETTSAMNTLDLKEYL